MLCIYANYCKGLITLQVNWVVKGCRWCIQERYDCIRLVEWVGWWTLWLHNNLWHGYDNEPLWLHPLWMTIGMGEINQNYFWSTQPPIHTVCESFAAALIDSPGTHRGRYHKRKATVRHSMTKPANSRLRSRKRRLKNRIRIKTRII